MVCFARAIGNSDLDTFGKYTDTPYLSHAAYQNSFRNYLIAAQNCAAKSKKASANEVRQLISQDITVSVVASGEEGAIQATTVLYQSLFPLTQVNVWIQFEVGLISAKDANGRISVIRPMQHIKIGN